MYCYVMVQLFPDRLWNKYAKRFSMAFKKFEHEAAVSYFTRSMFLSRLNSP